MKQLKSKPADPRETRKKIEEALGKHERGEPLNETETTIVYWLLHGGGCHACGGVKVAVTGKGGETG